MINSQSRKEYLRRIYKVQDYIETHLYDSILCMICGQILISSFFTY